MIMPRVTPFFWFDSQAEEAANFYVSIFPNSKITAIARYGEAGHEVHGREAGSVMTVAFELDGAKFVALNGGPIFRFNEAISFVIECKTQEEIDHYWKRLGEGGDPNAQQCGWLKDKFGVSWQVVPEILPELMRDEAKGQKVMSALMGMKKLDINALTDAHENA
jgi:predicted 3-demethylubiquinone-9 3-methyltransferase (glyoxalase superfamily)